MGFFHVTVLLHVFSNWNRRFLLLEDFFLENTTLSTSVSGDVSSFSFLNTFIFSFDYSSCAGSISLSSTSLLNCFISMIKLLIEVTENVTKPVSIQCNSTLCSDFRQNREVFRNKNQDTLLILIVLMYKILPFYFLEKTTFIFFKRI